MSVPKHRVEYPGEIGSEPGSRFRRPASEDYSSVFAA